MSAFGGVHLGWSMVKKTARGSRFVQNTSRKICTAAARELEKPARLVRFPGHAVSESCTWVYKYTDSHHAEQQDCWSFGQIQHCPAPRLISRPLVNVSAPVFSCLISSVLQDRDEIVLLFLGKSFQFFLHLFKKWSLFRNSVDVKERESIIQSV